MSEPDRDVWTFAAALIPFIGEAGGDGEVLTLARIVQLAHQAYGVHAAPLLDLEVTLH